MRVKSFNSISNVLKVEPDSFDDLYLLAMIVSPKDFVGGKSTRRFKSGERDTGEQKDVFVRLEVEKVDIDKSAFRLRLGGKIKEGHPEEFVSLGSHHTLNVAPGDLIEIQKSEWKDYILKRIKQAVADSKKPRLGIIVMDDEKATVSYVKGYGIDITSELYSHLSKKMSEKDFGKQQEKYFEEILASVDNMKVDTVVLAGPGFTKDDIKKYITAKNIEVKKKLVYTSASDAERSGIREVMQSDTVAKVLQSEHMKKEFDYLNKLLQGLRLGTAYHGPEKVEEQIKTKTIEVVLVNDSVINEENVKKTLDMADKHGIKIEIFNSDDDAGKQLHGFSDIAAI